MKARLLPMVLLVAACGGGGDVDYGDPVTVDPSTKSQITTALDSVTSLMGVETSPDSSTTLTKVSGLYAALGYLAPVCQAHAGKPEPQEIVGEALTKPIDQSCFTVTTGKVTYNNCNYGGGSINGSISYGAGTFSVNLTITATSSGNTFTVTEKGSITVTTTSISGSLDITSSGTFGTTTVHATYGADYDVTLTSGCATGGQIEFSASGNASTSAGSGSYSVHVKAEFGPTCGEIKLFCGK